MRARKPFTMVTVLVVLGAALVTTRVNPAGASGVPGTPIVVGMQAAAALRWSAPADAGPLPVTGYRVEVNDGSGWSTPTPDRGAGALVTGGSHSCALLGNGAVKCWGDNGVGQLGLGDTDARGDGSGEMAADLPAVALGTGRTAVTLVAGSSHTCAVLDDGTVRCWGDNGFGQLGLGDTNARGDGPGEMGDSLPPVALGAGRTAVALTAGAYHSCAVLDDATVKCWGYNGFGQLGLGDTATRGDGPGEMGASLPTVALGGGRTAVALGAGAHHTCAVLDNGTAKCWGVNSSGQLGLGDTATRGDAPGEMGASLPAVALGAGRTAVAITGGGSHTCSLLDNATVKCWGENGNGQLGLGNTVSRGDGPGEMGGSLPAVALGTGRTAVAIRVGAFSSCALLDDATVKCWGDNVYGQLGLGDAAARGDEAGEMGDALSAVALGAGRTAVGVSAGNIHACALLDDSTVKCWGNNAFGQLGLGDAVSRGDGPGEMGDSLPAVALRSERTAVALSSGIFHSCAVLSDGALKCFGHNDHGQLGLGDSAARGDAPGEMGDGLPAVALGTGRTAVAVSAGGWHSCALLDDATVKCWGDNFYGQLGLGDTAKRGEQSGQMGDALPAVALGAGRSAVAVSAGGLHSCALLDDASVKCWGINSSGELGLGDTDGRGDAPGEMGDNLATVALGAGRSAVALAAGANHTCALLDDGSVKCWGANGFGQLGLGDTDARGDAPGEMGDSLAAVAFGAGRTAVTLDADDSHSCAVLDDATVKCWGYNALGQLGLGDTDNRGDGPAELGDSLPAVALGVGRSGVAVSVGAAHSCAVLDDATVKCWGFNGLGGLGLGDIATRGDEAGEMGDSLPPVALGTGRTAVAVIAAYYHSCALLDDDTVRCWGGNGVGQLGLGDTADRGDGPGEMSDSLPAVELNGPVGGAPARAAVLRLAPGTYQFRVVALYPVGESAPSGVSAPVTVTASVTAPATPTIGPVTLSGTTASVAFTAPLNNGGSAITNYAATCTSSNGGATRTASGAMSPVSVPTLTAGKAYTCKVTATNVVGASGASAASNAVTVANLPGAPTAVKAASGAAAATGPLTVTFTAPVSNGGSVITGYTATCTSSNGGVTKTGVVSGAAAAPITVAAATTGKTYACTVKAANAIGVGAASAASPAVIVGSPVAPTAVKAVSGSTAAATGPLTVSFTAGANNGSAITSYTATCTSPNGGVTRTGSASASPVTVTAATTTKSYTCTVKAVNVRGAGPASAASPPLIVGSPARPTNVKAVPGSTAAATGPLTVTFTIGANNGSAITSQTATCTSSNGGVARTGVHMGAAAGPIAITGATTGKTYACTVKATNVRGAGLEAAPSLPVIVGSPAAPTGLAVLKTAPGQIRVSFTPGANNGSAITSYTATCVSSNGGATGTKTGGASPLTVTGLTTGKSYTCTVKATNMRGAGLASAPSVAVNA